MIFQDYWQSNISANKSAHRAILFDVDGTIVSGRNPMPGAEKILQMLRENHTPFLFLTNDSHHSPQQKAHLINRTGITPQVAPEEIVSCSHALALFVREHALQGQKVFIMGEFGSPCYAEAAGLVPCRDLEKIDECAFVIAGEGYFDWHDTFQAVMNYFIRHRERKLVVANPDSYWPSSDSGKLGIGAGGQARFIAGLLKEMSINIEVVYLGKPYRAIFDFALEKLRQDGNMPDLQASEVLMIGDALFSDIAGARAVGLTPALVMTGVTTQEILSQADPETVPELIFESLAAF